MALSRWQKHQKSMAGKGYTQAQIKRAYHAKGGSMRKSTKRKSTKRASSRPRRQYGVGFELFKQSHPGVPLAQLRKMFCEQATVLGGAKRAAYGCSYHQACTKEKCARQGKICNHVTGRCVRDNKRNKEFIEKYN